MNDVEYAEHMAQWHEERIKETQYQLQELKAAQKHWHKKLFTALYGVELFVGASVLLTQELIDSMHNPLPGEKPGEVYVIESITGNTITIKGAFIKPYRSAALVAEARRAFLKQQEVNPDEH